MGIKPTSINHYGLIFDSIVGVHHVQENNATHVSIMQKGKENEVVFDDPTKEIFEHFKHWFEFQKWKKEK